MLGVVRPMPQAAGSYPRTGKYQSNHGKNSHLYPVQKTATPEKGDRPVRYAMETGGVLMLLLSQPLTALAEDVATRL